MGQMKLALVPSGLTMCHWCNGLNGIHSKRCNVILLTIRGSVTIEIHDKAPNIELPRIIDTSFFIPAEREPTSLELFNKATVDGITIGHQWLNDYRINENDNPIIDNYSETDSFSKR